MLYLQVLKTLALITLLFPLWVWGQYLQADQEYLDSLEQVVERNEDPKDVLDAYEQISNIIFVSEPERDLEINLIMDSLASIGLAKSSTPADIDFYASKKAFALTNGGAAYYTFGNFYLAIQRYTEALELQEKIGNKQGIAAALNNIGMIYLDLDNLEKGLEYCEEALLYLEEINDSAGIGALHDNLGTIKKELGDTLTAFQHTYKGYQIRSSLEENWGLPISLNNVGLHYFERGNLDSAQHFFDLALKESLAIEDNSSVANSYKNLSTIEFENGRYAETVKLANLSLEYALKDDAALEIQDAYSILYQTYKEMGNYQKSLQMYEAFIDMQRSIQSQKNQEQVISEQYRYTYEKQAAQDSVKTAEEKKVSQANLEAAEAKSKQKEQESYILYGGLVLVALIGFFIYNRLQTTRKQKTIIEDQKKEVELQRQEILDSINYAKRIQSAILPPTSLIDRLLPQSFVLYLPKDIVAGDFYWLEQKEGHTLIAAADCTGHGVPGAMVSVVCNNGLNRSVREHGLTNPAAILDKTREIVIQEFEKSEEEVKDGMDIALCSIKGNTLHYSGANNPLWVLRKDAVEFEEIKANKQPIGKYANPEPFTSHEVQLNPGDTVYIFTDGYQDQFGGPKGKKLKASNLKKLILDNAHQPMSQQKSKLEQAFHQWKGDLDQLDDVCVIGFRF